MEDKNRNNCGGKVKNKMKRMILLPYFCFRNKCNYVTGTATYQA